jgi:hypothetical protein
LDFWFENNPSGNPDFGHEKALETREQQMQGDQIGPKFDYWVIDFFG